MPPIDFTIDILNPDTSQHTEHAPIAIQNDLREQTDIKVTTISLPFITQRHLERLTNLAVSCISLDSMQDNS